MTSHIIETPALTWVVCPDGSRIRAEDVRGVYVVGQFYGSKKAAVRLAVSHLPPGEHGNYTYSQHETEAEARLQADGVMHGVLVGPKQRADLDGYVVRRLVLLERCISCGYETAPRVSGRPVCPHCGSLLVSMAPKEYEAGGPDAD